MIAQFKVWDKKICKWIDPDDVRINPADGSVHGKRSGGNVDDWELVPFIGLKDKYGVEICKGDIVKCVDDRTFEGASSPRSGTFVIDQSLGGYGYEFDWEHVSGYDCPTHIMGNEDGDCVMPQVEIIGNIYQNPELREVEQCK